MNFFKKWLNRDRIRYQEALNKTIDAYKALLKDPFGEISHWVNYFGTYANCHLCNVKNVDSIDRLTMVPFHRCRNCPLRENTSYSLVDIPNPPCITKNWLILFSDLQKDDVDVEKVIGSARNRLAEILSIATSNGYKAPIE